MMHSVNWGDSDDGGFVTWDEAVQMWQAEALDKRGKYHRRWFATEDAAKKWAASWTKK